MKLNNLKVGIRLALAFGLTLFITSVIAGIGVWRLHELADTTRKLSTTDNEKLQMAVQWRQTIDLNWVRTRAAVLDGDSSRMAMWQADMDKTSQISLASRKRLLELVNSDKEKQLMADIDAARAAYRDPRAALLKRKQAGENVSDALERDLKPLADIYSESIRKLEQHQQAVYDAELVAAEKDGTQGRLILLVGGALAVLLGAASAFLISRSITVPLQLARRSARTIASGDLTQPIDGTGRDEAAELLRDLQGMQSNLIAIVGNVRQGTDSIATASSQIAAGNQDLSSRTEEQASSLEETAASMEELTSTVKQNADNARRANELALTASQIAVRGGTVVAQVVETMDAINASSRKIVDIIGVIDSIAFQTNILALNAAVEAARAGDQGRGFAVVASEVRTLAQRSAAAAKEIKGLIDDSVSNVQQGSVQVSEAGKTMQEIVSGVRRVTDIMGEITLASQEQTSGIEQINQAVAQMDQVTQQNAALVEEAAAAADALQGQAGNLSQAVSVFKLTGDDVPGRTAKSAAHTVARKSISAPPRAPRFAPSKLVAAQPTGGRAAATGSAADWETF